MIKMDNLMTPNSAESSESALVLSLCTPASLRTIELVSGSDRTQSKVWNYFGKYPAVVLNKQNIVVCKLCREECNGSETTSSKWEVNYGASKNTSKLNNHLQSKHLQS
jgi:hypothetical protein